MSTTIEGSLRAAAAALLALAGWAAAMMALPFLGPVGRQVVIAGDPRTAAQAVLAAGGSIAGVRYGRIIARSTGPAFVAALYREGAPLVLEARLAGGCSAGLSKRSTAGA